MEAHCLNEDVLETWHAQESANSRAGNEPADAVGRPHELPCWAGRDLVKTVVGHQELEMVFVAQEELVVRDFARFAAPALLEHNRKDVVDPLRHTDDLERKFARSKSKRTKNPYPAMQASSCLPHPGFKLKSNQKHAPTTFCAGSGAACIQDMIKDRSAGGGGLKSNQRNSAAVVVCFETVRDVQGFLRVESDFARQFPRDVAVSF